MANQVQAPTIKTENNALNQIQQNINKVLRNLNTQINLLQLSMSRLDIVGEIKLAGLTLAEFQSVAGAGWILANGQSSVGTDYEKVSGNKTVPNITVSGSTAFIKVNE